MAEVNNEGEWSKQEVDEYGRESAEGEAEDGNEEAGKIRKLKKGTIEYEYQIKEECKWKHWENAQVDKGILYDIIYKEDRGKMIGTYEKSSLTHYDVESLRGGQAISTTVMMKFGEMLAYNKMENFHDSGKF